MSPFDVAVAAEPVEARPLAARWYAADHKLSTRIGVLAGLIWGEQAAHGPVCTQAELDAYRAYLTEARMVHFIEEDTAAEAMVYVEAMQARIDRLNV